MTPKLEIHPADGDFVAATYTLDKTASVTGRGFSAFDAVANLRVYLQPFGYELPHIELYASGGAHAERTSRRLGTEPSSSVHPLGRKLPDVRTLGTTPRSVTSEVGLDELSAQTCERPTEVSNQSDPLASPISECESAVDRVFGGVYGNNACKN